MASMDDYRIDIHQLADKRDGTPSFNDSEAHAAIVMEEMFAHALHEVDILSNRLDSSVYGKSGTIAAAAQFLSLGEGRRLRILVEDKTADLSNHPLLSVCDVLGGCEVRYVPHEFVENFPYEYNFAVADGDSLRFEPDRTKCAAVVAFGNAQVGAHLKDIFEAVWTHGVLPHGALPSLPNLPDPRRMEV